MQHTTASLAKLIGGRLDGPDLPVTGVNSISDANATEITFIASARYARRWAQSAACAAVINTGLDAADHDPAHRALIVVDNAELALAQLLELFAPPPSVPERGIHPTAVVHESATIGSNPRIAPHVSVDREAVIGDDVVLHPGVRIGPHVTIGHRCELHANSVVEHRCVLGKSVVLHANVTIGADGFGYRPTADGRGLTKMPHIGNVRVDDYVEIGANSCIDRGKFSSTIIGEGTKIDNQVQIAHNCRIGKWCVIAAQSGLAGSVTVGDGVQIGAKAGAIEGMHIGDGARIAAGAGVMKDVPPGKTYMGIPAVESTTLLRQRAAIRQLPELMRGLKRRSGENPPQS